MTNKIFNTENGTAIELSELDLHNISRIYWHGIYRDNIDAFLDAYAANPYSFTDDEKDDIAELIANNIFQLIETSENEVACDVITSYEKSFASRSDN